MKRLASQLGLFLVLVAAYVALFIAGSSVFARPAAAVREATQPAAQTLAAIAVVACVDSLLVWLAVRSSRLHGWRLATLLAGVFYFVKTLTSTLEAAYFMPNLTRDLVPGLLLSTVPLALGFIPLAIWLGGRMRAGPLDQAPGFKPWVVGRGEGVLKFALLSAVVYPVLFFGAGWFIAFRSPELREFYGGARGASVFEHMAWLLAHEPLTLPLEVVRGALWVIAALLILQTTRGPWWQGTLLVALWFASIQNDVLLIPNPLMTVEIRAYHFVETASSNFVFALCIGWLFGRHLPPSRHTPGVMPVQRLNAR